MYLVMLPSVESHRWSISVSIVNCRPASHWPVDFHIPLSMRHNWSCHGLYPGPFHNAKHALSSTKWQSFPVLNCRSHSCAIWDVPVWLALNVTVAHYLALLGVSLASFFVLKASCKDAASIILMWVLREDQTIWGDQIADLEGWRYWRYWVNQRQIWGRSPCRRTRWWIIQTSCRTP